MFTLSCLMSSNWAIAIQKPSAISTVLQGWSQFQNGLCFIGSKILHLVIWISEINLVVISHHSTIQNSEQLWGYCYSVILHKKFTEINNKKMFKNIHNRYFKISSRYLGHFFKEKSLVYMHFPDTLKEIFLSCWLVFVDSQVETNIFFFF